MLGENRILILFSLLILQQVKNVFFFLFFAREKLKSTFCRVVEKYKLFENVSEFFAS